MKKRIAARISLVALLAGILVLTGSPRNLSATTLTANMTADNLFDFFISTSDTVAGNLIGSGNDWQTTFNFNTVLIPGVVNYLHVHAWDVGSDVGFIGSFTLSDTGFFFSNGSQSLNTDTTNWMANNIGFSATYLTPQSFGTNGVFPWGTRPNIDTGAEWIWAQDNSSFSNAYFSTAITPAAVPEPCTLLLLGGGLAGIYVRRRMPRKV